MISASYLLLSKAVNVRLLGRTYTELHRFVGCGSLNNSALFGVVA